MKILPLILLSIFTSLLFSAENVGAESSFYRVVQVAKGLEHPWSLAFLPDRRILVTERPGRLRIVNQNGIISVPIAGLPTIFNEGQGGLLDVVLDPKFKENSLIYFSYAEPQGDTSRTAVARARLIGTHLYDLEVIFRQQPRVESDKHFGSRLVFAKDGTLFITLGERFGLMDEAQKLDNHLGKLVRINPDGTIPGDNPFVQKQEILPEIWSYGHRNMQGAARHPVTGAVWTHEHGPRGGDEINIPRAGKNYGWPEASYGIHYWLIPIDDDHAEQGFEEPIYHWTPSIAPSGMMFYTGDIFAQWKGNLFVGALAKRHLNRLELSGNKVIKEERLLEELDLRIRDVEQGPDGYIYVISDAENGKILKLVPMN